MTNLHLKVYEDGTIYGGNVTEDGKMNTKYDVTKEALEAARDHLLIMTQKENKAMAYAWNYPNGKSIVMKLEERDTEELKDEPNEGVS